MLIAYLIWFFFLYLLPVILLFRISALTVDIIELRGLKIDTIKDDQENVKHVVTNYQEFIEPYSKITKFNIWIKLLENMCEDAHQEIKHEPDFYLLKYKNLSKRFLGFIFLGSFIPLIVTEIMRLDAYDIIFIHTICLFLVCALHRVICHKYEKFQDIFYKCWYDRILNFDLLTVKDIMPYILNTIENSKLPNAINKLAKIDREFTDILINHTNDLDLKLEELIELQKPYEEVTYNDFTESLNENIRQITDLVPIYDEITSKIKDSLNNLANIANNNIFSINAISENTAALIELKKILAEDKNYVLSQEVQHMKEVTYSLRGAINRAFNSIVSANKSNSEDLNSSYEKLYKLCDSLAQLPSENNYEGIVDSLKSISDNIDQRFREFDAHTALLEDAIKSMNDSTQKICENLFNFSQFTSSPPFMQMQEIKNNENLKNELLKASKNLISYEKLVKVYEHDISNDEKIKAYDEKINQFDEKIKQLNKVTFKIAGEMEKLKDKEQPDRVSIQKEPIETPATPKKNDDNPILAAFNAWAARPTVNLPDNFIYVKGNIRLKKRQNIGTSTGGTRWITNKGNGVKFLFPNPLFFDDRTDISELYEGDMNKLKKKDNKIEVLEPCEISENGFIHSKGKFRLL